MRRLAVVLFVLLLFSLSIGTAWADDRDEWDRGRKAPEVPFALVYPATALAGYGLYRFGQSRRRN
ncbi:MAG: hypothetical protein M1358_13220 [Chloroflexi bacterium]|nr:hypothetical protein [Chloroflexota bacterium]